MSYAIKNLREAEDMAPKFGFAEVQEVRFPWRDVEAQDTGFALIFVKPGKRQGIAHRHEDAEEVYVVLRGDGRIKLDDETAELRPYDAVRVSPAVTRSFEAGEEGLEVLAFGARRAGDGELVDVEQFWA